ncbi:MAG: ATP-binding protein, partial [Spirochaetales bacterium]|nr:ATP-binding protein [Spirochaetales bacterium]
PSKINYKELQTTFGLKSDKTAENYVHYLKNTYLIVGLHKYSAKSKIRIRDEKAYSVDVALMNNRNLAFASENLGWRLETIIYIELLRRCSPLEHDIYYYEETAGECDFVVCQGSTVIQLIQVSYDISMPKTRKREIAGLLLASRKTGCDNLLLITNDEEGQEIHEDKTIQIEPAYQWLVQNG